MKLSQSSVNQHYDNNIKYTPDERIKYYTDLSHSGYALLSKLTTTDKILDIGCGCNLFKPHFPSLVGIDPASEYADIKVSLQDYVADEKFNVLLVLGSIQYGEYDDILTLVKKMVSLATPKSKIYWRCNYKNTNPQAFLWTPELHVTVSRIFGFAVREMIYESCGDQEKYRLYVEWER